MKKNKKYTGQNRRSTMRTKTPDRKYTPKASKTYNSTRFGSSI